MIELQELLRRHCNLELSIEDVRDVGQRLLRLGRVLTDRHAFELPQPSGGVQPPALPRRKLVAHPAPIPLERDHAAEVLKNLRLLIGELESVQSRPSNWRWIVVALHDAVGYSLALLLGKNVPLPDTAGVGHLLTLSAAVRAKWRELPDVQSELQRLELIRTTYLPYGVSEWPASREQLLTDVQRLLVFLQQVFATAPSELSSARWTLIRARLVQALAAIPAGP